MSSNGAPFLPGVDFTARLRDPGLQFDFSVHSLTYCPMRWARAVKKMPLGALAGSCAMRAKLRVS